MVRVSQAGSIAGIKKGIEICKKELPESRIFVGIWKILLETGKNLSETGFFLMKSAFFLARNCWNLAESG